MLKIIIRQVALEGEISREAVSNALKRGLRENIDGISWTIDGQFPHLGFNRLSGARIVTIATHPDLQRKGYGSRTLKLLIKHFEGELAVDEMEDVVDEELYAVTNVDPTEILKHKMKLKAKLPPLFIHANKARLGKLDYVGVTYDASYPLVRFFKNKGLVPVYVDTDRNLLTEEHNCIMLKALKQKNEEVKKEDGCDDNDAAEEGDDNDVAKNGDDDDWLSKMFNVFRHTFVLNLNMECRGMDSPTALAVMKNQNVNDPSRVSTRDDILFHFSEHNLKLLDEFANNRIDHTQIPDVVTKVAKHVFEKKLNAPLDSFQSTLLLAKGLQKKTSEEIVKELKAVDIKMDVKMIEGAIDLAIKAPIKSLKAILKTGEITDDSCRNEKPDDNGKVSLKRMAKSDDQAAKKLKKLFYAKDLHFSE